MDEHALMFGGVEFGEPLGPEQLPLLLFVLWYIIESPMSRQKNLFKFATKLFKHVLLSIFLLLTLLFVLLQLINSIKTS